MDYRIRGIDYACLMLVVVMSYGYGYGYDFAGLHFRVLLAFDCRYYVSFLFVELALISNGSIRTSYY